MQTLTINELSQAVEDLESKKKRTETENTSLLACKKVLDMVAILQEKDISVSRLKQMVFGVKTEKKSKNKGSAPDQKRKTPKTRTSGRLTPSAYKDAEVISCPHETLNPGDQCPECERGNVYKYPKAEEIIIEGKAPFKATLLELERLRCAACGFLFTAKRPSWAPPGKYDEKAKAMVILLKYGYGLPFFRLEKLQRNLKTPFPTSTQWDQVVELMPIIKPVFLQMLNEASQGDLLYADDTRMKILSEMTEHTRNKNTDRKGIQTSVIVSAWDEAKAVLFFTGYNHAGDNIAELLKRRSTELEKPIQMTDALQANTSHDFDVWISYCLAHARRKFFELQNYFPEECEFVLSIFKQVYKNEAKCIEKKLTPKERLEYHQMYSMEWMSQLEKWCHAQFNEKRIEPNCSLGTAIRYLSSHWVELTLFLRKQGVPLDNTESERQLKRAILNRKNAYFFKTLSGAEIGSMYMSLIATCEENNVNPFDYLVLLQKESSQVLHQPERYLPWKTQEYPLKI